MIPTLKKKTPHEILSVIDGNVLMIGNTGTGKTLALKTFARSLIQDNKRVLFLDHYEENHSLAKELNGESIGLREMAYKKVSHAFTNLAISPNELSSNLLLRKVVLDTLDTAIENHHFDYIFIDESQWYLAPELLPSFLTLLQIAREHGVKIIISLQIFRNFPITEENKGEILEYAPQVLLFDGQDFQLNQPEFRMATGESILFHIKHLHSLYFVPFEIPANE